MRHWFEFEIKRPLYHLYQKLRYGVSHRDCWSLDTFFARKIAAGLQMFINMNRHGMPAIWDSDESDHDILLKEYFPIWEAILYKMLDGFERISVDMESDPYDGAGEARYRRECLDLFAEFFEGLWD